MGVVKMLGVLRLSEVYFVRCTLSADLDHPHRENLTRIVQVRRPARCLRWPVHGACLKRSFVISCLFDSTASNCWRIVAVERITNGLS